MGIVFWTKCDKICFFVTNNDKLRHIFAKVIFFVTQEAKKTKNVTFSLGIAPFNSVPKFTTSLLTDLNLGSNTPGNLEPCRNRTDQKCENLLHVVGHVFLQDSAAGPKYI